MLAVLNVYSGPSESLLMPANGYQNGTNGIIGNSVLLAPGLVPGGYGSLTPSMQLSVNTVDAVTESIKSDRTIRMWKVEAMKVSCFRSTRKSLTGSNIQCENSRPDHSKSKKLGIVNF